MASHISIHFMKRLFLFFLITVIVLLLIYASLVTLSVQRKRRPIGHSGFPKECVYTKLRKHVEPLEAASCKPRIPQNSSCLVANHYFGNPWRPLNDSRKCDSIQREICWFERNGKRKSLRCSPKVCSSKDIYMSKRDPKLGHVTEWTKIHEFTTKKALTFVVKVFKQGETYCFIKCGTNILQVLVFPPELYLKKAHHSNDKININIIAFDSVSRPHFYRLLRKSIEALKNLTHDESLVATVLDFELFQSISPHTFENIQPLFSGVVEASTDFGQASKKNQNREVGFNVLYERYKSHGYQTIFQEDLCWYDRWGTLLDNIKVKGSSKPTAERWLEFQKTIKKHKIDNFGLTFFSCEVFKKYNDTNHFETPSKVCFNGQFFSSFFFRYIQALTDAVKNIPKYVPYISYTHFNTGHTGTGLRIGNVDEGLADFISNIARDPLTWTIFLSDHGHKTTSYVTKTTDGKYETFNPLLFMIIPPKVSQIIGKERMEALKINQNRLLTTLDVHKGIMSLNDKRPTKHDIQSCGIFAKIPSNRKCNDVPLMPLAKCQCSGNKQKYEDNSPKHKWMAEFALGSLNNEIQKQYSKGNSNRGFGNCRRLIGSSFRNIVQTGNLMTFDLHVNATYVGLIQDEIFKIAIAIKTDNAVFKSFERQTMYNKFKDCVDESVDIKLCVCDQRLKKKTFNTAVWNRTDILNLLRLPVFGSEAIIKNIKDNCLFQVNRHHSNTGKAVEVSNVCEKQSFEITVSGWTNYVFLSNSLPIKILVQPKTIYFLFSAAEESSHSSMSISLKVKKQK